jgi:hypothetical protein
MSTPGVGKSTVMYVVCLHLVSGSFVCLLPDVTGSVVCLLPDVTGSVPLCTLL